MRATSLLLMVPALAGAASVKSDLQAKYTELALAFSKQDTAPFEADLAKDYTLHVGSQTHDRTYVLADFKKEMAAMKNVRWTRTVTKVKKTGDGLYVATVKSTFNGDFDQDKKTHHFWNTAISDDTWTQSSDKQWQLTESNLITLDAKVDGKSAGHFPPPKTGG